MVILVEAQASSGKHPVKLCSGTAQRDGDFSGGASVIRKSTMCNFVLDTAQSDLVEAQASSGKAPCESVLHCACGSLQAAPLRSCPTSSYHGNVFYNIRTRYPSSLTRSPLHSMSPRALLAVSLLHQLGVCFLQLLQTHVRHVYVRAY